MMGVRRTAAGLRLGGPIPVSFNAATAAAAGSTQATATPLTASVNHVTGADGTKGVRLPAIAQPGQIVAVYNATSAQALKVYPPTGGTINGGAANAAVTQSGLTLALFIATSSTNWAAIVS
jgi:hypothetical protein